MMKHYIRLLLDLHPPMYVAKAPTAKVPTYPKSFLIDEVYRQQPDVVY